MVRFEYRRVFGMNPRIFFGALPYGLWPTWFNDFLIRQNVMIFHLPPGIPWFNANDCPTDLGDDR